MGNKSNFYKKPFFITKKSIPVWMGFVSLAIALVFFFGIYFEINDEARAVAFLNVNAELLVTILAVTMSFTLLGLQFLAESYTPRALGTYLKDKVIYGFPILYISLISLSLISSTFSTILPPVKFVQFAVIGTIFSLVYLVGFIYYMIGKIQPEKVIADTAKNIPDEVWKEIIENEGLMDLRSPSLRPFIILEQTMIKAVNNNDVFSFVQGLGILFHKLELYLENIQNEFLIHKKPAKRGWDSDYVYTFFFRLFSQLFAECLNQSREQFIMQYQWHLFQTFRKLYEYKHTRALDDFWEHIEYLGKKIFNLEMIAACDLYTRLMKELMKIEFEIVKKNRDSYYEKDSLGHRYIPKTSDEFDIGSLTDDFRRDRIESLGKFGTISAEKKIEKLVSSINWILQDTLSDSLQLIDRSTRRMIVYTILESMQKIHRKCVDRGIGSGYMTLHWLDNYLKKLDIRYVDEGKELTEAMCKRGLYSIEHKDYMGINQLGALCRVITDKHPESVIVLLEYLDKAYDVVQKETDDETKSKWTKEIIKEIESAEKWNKNHHKGISEKVTELLEFKT